MRTDAPIFQDLIESRRNRSEDWYHAQAGRIEISNVPIPVRPVATPPASHAPDAH
jgi:peptidylprolyl isomerase